MFDKFVSNTNIHKSVDEDAYTQKIIALEASVKYWKDLHIDIMTMGDRLHNMLNLLASNMQYNPLTRTYEISENSLMLDDKWKEYKPEIEYLMPKIKGGNI